MVKDSHQHINNNFSTDYGFWLNLSFTVYQIIPNSIYRKIKDMSHEDQMAFLGIGNSIIRRVASGMWFLNEVSLTIENLDFSEENIGLL